jgi:Spy/CpxP family protein refolding chaperone
MNRRFRTFLLGAAVIAISVVSMASSLLTTYANAQVTGQERSTRRPGMHRGFGFGAPLISIALRHKTELNLSADQVANLEKIRANYQSQMTPVVQQLRGFEGQIQASLQQTPANLIQVRSLIEQSEKPRSELRYLRIEALENGKSVLTAQQRDQLKNLVVSMRRNFRKPQQPQGS